MMGSTVGDGTEATRGLVKARDVNGRFLAPEHLFRSESGESGGLCRYPFEPRVREEKRVVPRANVPFLRERGYFFTLKRGGDSKWDTALPLI